MSTETGGAVKGIVKRKQAQAQNAEALAMIDARHSQTMVQVNKLRTVASELGSLHTKAQNALGNINDFWEGGAADKFAIENEGWRRELKSIEQEIDSLTTSIQKTADWIKTEETQKQQAFLDAFEY